MPKLLEAIVRTEDRDLFKHEILKIGERVAEGSAATNIIDAEKAAEKVLNFHLFIFLLILDWLSSSCSCCLCSWWPWIWICNKQRRIKCNCKTSICPF